MFTSLDYICTDHIHMQWHITETLSTDNELHWQANINLDLNIMA